MKEKKNNIAVLTSLLCALVLTASACGEAASPVSAPDDGNTADTAALQAETEAPVPAEYTAPGHDYGGETITLAAVDYYTNHNGGVWRAADYCEVFSSGENGDPINDAIYRRNQMLAETLNVKVELFSISGFANTASEFRTPVMAGDDVIDIGMVQARSLPSLLTGNMLVDLHELPGVDFSHSWWDKAALEEVELYGKLQAATGDISLLISFAPITYFFNKQLIETLDLENPYALVDSGKWTLPTAMQMCKAAARDLNGDGAMTIEDSFGMFFEPTTLGYAVSASGIRMTDKDKDGNPQLALDLDRASKLIDQFLPFMQDKNLNILSSNYTGYNNTFTDLMLPMFIDNRGLFYNNQMLVALNLRDMNADFGILPPPKLDEAQNEYCVPINDWWGTFSVVPVTNTKYEMTGDVLEAMGFYGQQYITPAFIDTTVNDKALRDEDSSRMLEIIFSNRVYDLAVFYDWGGVNTMFSNLVGNKNGASKFTSTYASIEKKAAKAIEKTVAELNS